MKNNQKEQSKHLQTVSVWDVIKWKGTPITEVKKDSTFYIAPSTNTNNKALLYIAKNYRLTCPHCNDPRNDVWLYMSKRARLWKKMLVRLYENSFPNGKCETCGEEVAL